MPKLNVFTPLISVRLYKTISRVTISGNEAVSARYAGRNAYIDLTPYLGDGSSVRTSKSVREAAGAFSITFADKPNQSSSSLESIYGLAEPMDIVEIRMWSGEGKKPAVLPIKMRGFVSEIRRNQSIGDDGKPNRSVIISGQDYGKIWQMYQVVYLAAYAEGETLLTAYALNRLFGVSVVNCMSSAAFVREMITKVINKYLDGLMPKDAEMPRLLKTGDSISVKHGAVNNSFHSMQGAIYDILKHHADVGIWNELYTEDREDGVHVVYRPTPALRFGKSNRKIQEDMDEPVFVDIPDTFISSYSVSRSDASVANFYWVNNSRFDLIDDMQRRLSSIPPSDSRVSIKDYFNSAVKFYGTRPMMAESQQGDDALTHMNSGLPANLQAERAKKQDAWLDKRRQVMQDMNKDNVIYERGTAKIKGGIMRADGSHLKAGDYGNFIFGGINSEAYIVKIDDEFIPLRSYTATVTFERGTGFAVRTTLDDGARSPWLAEQH